MTYILLGPLGSSPGEGSPLLILLVALIFSAMWTGYTIPPVAAGVLTGGVCSLLFRYPSAWPAVNIGFNMGFVAGSVGLLFYSRDAFGLLPPIPGPWWGFLAVLTITIAIATAITSAIWWRCTGTTYPSDDNTGSIRSGIVIFSVSLGAAAAVVFVGAMTLGVSVYLSAYLAEWLGSTSMDAVPAPAP